MPEIHFENYQNDTLILLQGEFLSNGGKVFYDAPLADGEHAVAILVEGDALRVTLSADHGRPLPTNGGIFAPQVGLRPSGNQPLFFFSPPQSSRLELSIQATAGTNVSFSILVQRADAPILHWLDTRQGSRKLVGFVLRCSLASLGVPRFDLDGFLPDGALEKFHGTLIDIRRAPGPLRAFLGRFEEDTMSRIVEALGTILTQIECPYDHLLTSISQHLDPCQAEPHSPTPWQLTGGCPA